MIQAPPSSAHRWSFFRAGGFDQVRIDRGEDLLALASLDQKLWVALACPTRGIEIDARTLDLVDTDRDGRIRPPELLEAVRYAAGCLVDPQDLLRGGDTLPLARIDGTRPEGARILASARRILENLGRPGSAAIALEDTTDTARIFAATRFNGDGIVPADAADDPAVAAVIGDIVACLGGEPDRSGRLGVSQPKLERFFAEASAFSDWWSRVESDRAVLPLDQATGAAAAAVRAVKGKVDDYFARCRLAAFDPRALSALNRSETEYLDLAARDLSIDAAEVSGFPLARVAAGAPLPLAEGLNPAWAAAIAGFRQAAVEPLLGPRTSLSQSDWEAIGARLAPYEAWAASKAGASVETLGLDRVRAILAGPSRGILLELLARDRALAPEAEAIAAVEKLVRFHRDLGKLVRNFVSFRDFYGRQEKAAFQAGTLFIDQRACELCIRVEDAGKHAAMAGLSGVYLAYCDLERRSTGEKMAVAAAFTDGDSDNLMVGRNGVFYDRAGRDWDATIARIVDNPISIRQAFWSPYKKMARLVSQQVQKLAAGREKKVEEAAASKVDAGGRALEGPKPPEKKEPFDVGRFVGMFAAIGLALGGIGAALGALLTAFTRLEAWQMPIALLGMMLAVSGPSMVLAWLKLRQRNLAPLLDANGWAVNAKARINIPFGASLTQVAALPAGSQRDLADPYAEKKTGRKVLAAIVVVAAALAVLWWLGVLDACLPAKLAREAAPPAAEATK